MCKSEVFLNIYGKFTRDFLVLGCARHTLDV